MEDRQIEQVKKAIFKFDKNMFLIMGLVGILLFIIVLPMDNRTYNSDNTTENEVETVLSEQVVSANYESEVLYGKALEEKLIAILSTMDGVGEVSVMITLQSTYEEVLQKDTSSSVSEMLEDDGEGGSRSTYEMDSSGVTVYEKLSDGSNVPYIIKKNTPEIEGVLVVAQGGGNASICVDITSVIQALFGIEAHKIKVVKMKS